jgi:hypothetical protein
VPHRICIPRSGRFRSLVVQRYIGSKVPRRVPASSDALTRNTDSLRLELEPAPHRIDILRSFRGIAGMGRESGLRGQFSPRTEEGIGEDAVSFGGEMDSVEGDFIKAERRNSRIQLFLKRQEAETEAV